MVERIQASEHNAVSRAVIPARFGSGRKADADDAVVEGPAGGHPRRRRVVRIDTANPGGAIANFHHPGDLRECPDGSGGNVQAPNSDRILFELGDHEVDTRAVEVGYLNSVRS